MTDYLPCPFCGGYAISNYGGARQDGGTRVGFAFVRCSMCSVEKGVITGAPDGVQALEEATVQWNERTAPPPYSWNAADLPALTGAELTDDQCNHFRRLPLTFNDMVRTIYVAGQRSVQVKP